MLIYIYTLLKILSIVIPLLISVAYFTLAERKIMGSIQRRKGPNVIGYLGLLQPLADGLKLFVKETILPSNANLIIFLIAPMLTFILSLIFAIPSADPLNARSGANRIAVELPEDWQMTIFRA